MGPCACRVAVGTKAEPTLRVVELHRRHTEIEEHAIDGPQAEARQVFADVGVVPVNEGDAFSETPQALSRAFERVGVSVDADNAGVGVRK